MTWSKLDDGMHTHPKFLDAGLEATGFWSLALSYCGAQLTDGHVKRAALARLAGSPEKGEELAQRLVAARGGSDVGLWEVDAGGDGYRFHDYLDFNPSRAKVLADRESKKTAGSLGAAKRWGKEPIAPAIAEPITGATAPPPALPSESGMLPIPIPSRSPEREISPAIAPAIAEPITGATRRPLPASEPKLMGAIWRAEYETAVRDATGDDAWSFDLEQLGALTALIEQRCPDRSKIPSWLAERVAAFVAATRGEAKFYSAFQPKGLRKWLDEASGAKPIAALVQRGSWKSARAGGRS